MINLVLGRSGTGKTEYIRNLLSEKAEKGDNKLLLIVPEQFSYSSERALLEKLGSKNAQNVEVLSFTRLADYISREYGGLYGIALDDADKMILILHTLNDVKDSLDYYNLQTESIHFAKELLLVFTEFRKQHITAKDLATAASKSKNVTLKKKLLDLSTILERFDSILEENGYTDENLISYQVLNVLKSTKIFDGYTICIDAFKGFTGQEFEIIEELASQANEIFIALTVDVNSIDKEDSSMIFGAVKETIYKLREIAGNSVKIIDVTADKNRFKSEALSFLEQNIFTTTDNKFGKDTDDIVLFAADTKYDECNYIAATVRKLLRKDNMRLRDIAVIARNEENYRNELVAAFSRYGVPVFEDVRQPVINQPLIVLCKTLLNIMMSRKLNTKDILTFLKTGFSPLSETEASELENYVYIWNIQGDEWTKPFTDDPRGSVYEKDEKSIAKINSYRESVITVLESLRKDISTPDGKKSKIKPIDVSKKIYSFLKEDFVKEKLKAYAKELNDAENTELAAEQNRIWELIMFLLDKLASIQGDYEIPLFMYSELFSAACDMMTLGSIPHGLDELTIGSADRTRLSNPEVVFVCGCIEGEFPLNIKSSGLLSNADRRTLKTELDIELSPTDDILACDERFIAYSALTSSRKKLFVTCHTKTGANEMLSPSPIYAEIKTRFGDNTEKTTKDFDAYYYSETDTSAFSAYASGFRMRSEENAEKYNTIKAALESRKNYTEKIDSLDNVRKPKNYDISSETAQELFGKRLSLSPSSIEVFYNCPFQYFCRYGLSIYPRERVSFTSQVRGLAIHYVLEQILRTHSKEEFENLSEKEREELSAKYLQEYLDDSNIESIRKDPRFMYNYNQTARVLSDVLTRMIEEFKVSEFEPVDYEHQVIKEIDTDDPDTKMSLTGKIDRVDRFVDKDNKTYIRIVDYKSYTKDFDLDHIVSGLSLQMLIYLFALKDEKETEGEHIIPAGILYYNVSGSALSLSEEISDDERLKKIIDGKKNNGMYLDNDAVLCAMEANKEGRFYKAGDVLKGLVSEDEIKLIEELVNEKLEEMIDTVKAGKINIHPITEDGETVSGCKYCKYSHICGFEGEDIYCNDISKITFKDYVEEKVGEQNG